jgi:3-deoxy-D-manno-octulosonic-acid transferase
MNRIYTLGIYIFIALVRLASVFNPKARLMISGRKQWKAKLAAAIDTTAEYTWFHCSSLGEFEQGRPLIEAYKLKNPTVKIVLTFFSPSGYEIRKNYAVADYVCYIPFDTKRNARDFVSIVKPKETYFVKYEFWPNFLTELHKSGSLVFLVSAIFRPEQLFFRWYGGWYRNVLSLFDTIYVQDKNSETLLTSINKSNCKIVGDTRFDRVSHLPATPFSDPLIEGFCGENFVVVCGSTWPPDEEIIAQLLASKQVADLKIILVPHEIGENHLQSIESKFPQSVRYTKTNIAGTSAAKVLIIDTIGKLSMIYRYGKLAYIGGGFGVGIHNTLEAAVYGLPVIFGPNYKKFREAVQLIETEAAFSISDSDSLLTTVKKLANSPELLNKASENAASFVKNNTGATNIILDN